MTNLSIETIQIEPKIEHVKFSGVLDASGQDAVLQLEQTINKYEDGTNVIFDFKNLEYLNSYAIGFIAHWYNHLTKKQGSILLINPQPQVYDTLNVLGITGVLKIYEDIDQALETIRK